VRVVGDREFESNGEEEEEVGGRKKPRGKESPNPSRDGMEGKGEGQRRRWALSASNLLSRTFSGLESLVRSPWAGQSTSGVGFGSAHKNSAQLRIRTRGFFSLSLSLSFFLSSSSIEIPNLTRSLRYVFVAPARLTPGQILKSKAKLNGPTGHQFTRFIKSRLIEWATCRLS
jgi:hypothetical protein